MQDTTSIVTAIIRGNFDNDLNKINDALRSRQRIVTAQTTAMNMATVNVGDKVRIIDIKPQYLQGTVATVTGKKQSRLVVTLPTDYRLRGYSGKTGITIPAVCVEPVTN